MKRACTQQHHQIEQPASPILTGLVRTVLDPHSILLFSCLFVFVLHRGKENSADTAEDAARLRSSACTGRQMPASHRPDPSPPSPVHERMSVAMPLPPQPTRQQQATSLERGDKPASSCIQKPAVVCSPIARAWLGGQNDGKTIRHLSCAIILLVAHDDGLHSVLYIYICSTREQ
jgi:hypothetical protein